MEHIDEREHLRSMSTADLFRHALEEAKLLAQAEVKHAKEELRQEVKQAKAAGVALGAAAALALGALSVLLVLLALALPVSDIAGLAIVAVVVLAISGGLGMYGYRKIPRKPLPKTTERLKKDYALTKEQLA